MINRQNGNSKEKTEEILFAFGVVAVRFCSRDGR
jgi:hypothetical protein